MVSGSLEVAVEQDFLFFFPAFPLVFRHKPHSHWLLHFLLGLKRDCLPVVRPKAHRHLFSDGSMSVKLHLVLFRHFLPPYEVACGLVDEV